MKRILGFLLLMTVLMAGCKDEKTFEEELAEIDTYIEENGYTAMETASGLHYVVLEDGLGFTNPEPDSDVTVDYRGELLDGTIFDQNQAIEFNLQGVVQGWQEGIQLMNVGDRYLLIFPSALGYGSRGSGSIPGYAPLVFDVTLRDF